MKNKIIILGVFVLVAAVGLWVGFAMSGSEGGDPNKTTLPQQGSLKQFNRIISDFSYQPPSVDVNKGDYVVINITNKDSVRHGINLPAFGVADFVDPGETKQISFLADKTGSPELFCSSDHGEKLIVNVNG